MNGVVVGLVLLALLVFVVLFIITATTNSGPRRKEVRELKQQLSLARLTLREVHSTALDAIQVGDQSVVAHHAIADKVNTYFKGEREVL